MKIRLEQAEDFNAIRLINLAAFETDDEAKLVEEIRKKVPEMTSLIAEKDEQILGHIMFSPAKCKNYPSVKIAGLAPMAVLPEHQNSGIGSKLIKAGLEACKNSGYQAVVVLGHPNYYPKFGFIPSVNYDLTCEYDVPPEVFMVLEFQKDILKRCKGIIEYHPVFKML